jgi:hypothetical protein
MLLSEKIEIIRKIKYSEMNEIYNEITKIKEEIKENIEDKLFLELDQELKVIYFEINYPDYYEDGTYIYINFKDLLSKLINELKLKEK